MRPLLAKQQPNTNANCTCLPPQRQAQQSSAEPDGQNQPKQHHSGIARPATMLTGIRCDAPARQIHALFTVAFYYGSEARTRQESSTSCKLTMHHTAVCRYTLSVWRCNTREGGASDHQCVAYRWRNSEYLGRIFGDHIEEI